MNNYLETFNRDFGLTKLPKSFLKNQEVYNLFTKPLKENTFDIDIFNIDKLSENFQEKIKSYQ